MTDGSAASPGFAFSSDTNTGFHRPASDTIGFSVGGNEEFRMASDGSFHADSDIIAYSTTIASDRRLKENISPLQYGLEELLKIQPVSYDWKLGNRGSDIGVIAQDLLDIVPEIITKSEMIGDTRKWFEENYEGAEPYRYGVDYAKLTLILINSVKELEERIKKLEKDV